MTKTPHGPGSHEACAAFVSYKGADEPCKRAGTYPDADGKRFWCGLHNPAVRQRREQEKADRQVQVATEAREAADTVMSNEVKAGMVNDILTALEDARTALITIGNTKDTGWSAGTPVDKYQTLLSHVNTIAGNAGERASAALRKVQADIGRANRAA